MATTGRLITAEELWRMPEPNDGGRYELLKGELIHTTPAGGRHGQTAASIARILCTFVKERGL